MSTVLDRVSNHIWNQFNSDSAIAELNRFGPEGVDWVSRTRTTIDTLLPHLPPLAENLRKTVPKKLNSPKNLNKLIKEGSEHISKSNEALSWLKEINELSDLSTSLVENLESQQVSAEIQRFIISQKGLGSIVYANGNSIYPDLILCDRNYGSLPFQNRKKPVEGPCLRGKKTPRPSNVPDGCEIKTNKGTRVGVDAHGAHPGLHLWITWDNSMYGVEINGVWLAYVRICDHRESGRNVKVTTVKYSFGHGLFTSLLD